MTEEHCSNCGHSLANGARFCEECGEPARNGRHAKQPKSNDDAVREFISWLKWLLLTKNPSGKEGKWALTRLLVAACVVVFLAVTIPIGICVYIGDQGTPSTLASLVTNDATGVGSEVATLNGYLSDIGTASNVNVSFQWGTISGSYLNETTPVMMSGEDAFTARLTGLQGNTTYYFRARAVGRGASYGTEKIFQTSGLITRDASELTLTLDDFEAGWRQGADNNVTKPGAQSAHFVNFDNLYTSVVQNQVEVYPTVDLAKEAYTQRVPPNISLAHPSIGEECFLDVSKVLYETLVFRDANVVVWIWVVYDNAEPYAQKVAAKIN
jgi:hypothetical protein